MNTSIEEQFSIEKKWRKLILSSKKGNERRKILTSAYKEVNQHIKSYQSFSKNLVDKTVKQSHRIKPLASGSSKNVKFLDVGCSEGEMTLLFLNQGWDAYGIDIEVEVIEAATESLKKIKLESKKTRFFVGELYDLPEKNFDLIFHSDVLEHIHPDEAIDFNNQIYSLLNSNGKLIFVTPHRLIGPKDISKFFLSPGEEAQGLHLKEYYFYELVNLLKLSGFNNICCYLFSPDIYPFLSSIFGYNGINVKIKIYFEKLLILLNKLGLNKLSQAISIRFDFSFIVAIK